MRKYLITLILIGSVTVVCAQDRKIVRAIEANIENNEEHIMGYLKSYKLSLEERYKKMIDSLALYGNRQFSPELDENGLIVELNKHSLQELLDNPEKTQALLDRAKGVELAQFYREILRIHQSLKMPYNEETNERYKERLSKLKCISTHLEGFQQLFQLVDDYRFVVFELVRVMELIDKMKAGLSADEIRGKLNENNELAFIYEGIPYAYRALNDYIEWKADGNEKKKMDELKTELRKSCPAAFGL